MALSFVCVCVCVWPRFLLSDKQCTIHSENKHNKSYRSFRSCAAAATNCYRKNIQRLKVSNLLRHESRYHERFEIFNLKAFEAAEWVVFFLLMLPEWTFLEAIDEWKDISDLLPQIQNPTFKIKVYLMNTWTALGFYPALPLFDFYWEWNHSSVVSPEKSLSIK